MIFHTYLTAYFFWLALALGCLSILMVHNLAGGYWGAVIRRPLEAGATTLPLLAVLFIPLLIGMPVLFPGLSGNITVSTEAPQVLGHLSNPILGFKLVYLNTAFFLARLVVYFLIWIILMLLLVRWSRQRDTDPTPALTARLRNLSAIGLVLMGLTVSFAGVDWLMTLDPAWNSSIWGLIVVTGVLMSGIAFGTLVVALRNNRPPFAGVISPALFNSLGSLMLAFLMLWGYMSISQVILYYAGNLSHEAVFYVRRTTGGWTIASILVGIVGFVIPFGFLVIRGAKRDLRVLAAVCIIVLASQFLHWYWIVQPTFNDNALIAGILTVVLAVAIGVLWLIVFIWQFSKAPEVSPVEPKLIAAREEHEAMLAERAHEEQAYADRIRAEQAHD